MLEALVAIGLAGNVITFVQFTSQLLAQAKVIRRDGAPSSYHELKDLISKLTQELDIIQAQVAANGAKTVLAQEDQYILDLATECQKAAEAFSTHLEEIYDIRASRNIIRSIQASVNHKWQQYRFDSFTRKLDQFRDALTLATLLSLRAKTDGYNKDVIAYIQDLKSATLASTHHNKESLQRLQTPVAKTDSGQTLASIQADVNECLIELGNLRKELPCTREHEILRWLNFRQMTWRYEEVLPAYQETFKWIFHQSVADKPWDNFHAYLTEELVDDLYWVNGKAGSGKSTLMKFIVTDSRTHEALCKLQNSNVGMLRALLHSVLEQHPELIPAVFPTLYQNWKDSDVNIEPIYAEVKKAFELLLSKCCNFLKLCIFVDGIDEFEGDHRDISEFLRSIVSPNVKIVASSRPIPACVNVFKNCPTVNLQDLTKGDMEIFINGNLGSHSDMSIMKERYPSQIRRLTDEILFKAAGVFLWVKIVVRLLIDGLEAGDDIEQLNHKLYMLPPDLRDLYERMISRMPAEYQFQAAEIFQLFHTWNTTLPDQSLTTIGLCFAMEPPSEGSKRKVELMDRDTEQWLCQSTEARIRSRCCGLIEIHKKPISGMNTPPPHHYSFSGSTVEYLHRTVAEFLTSEDVWQEICNMTKDLNFDPLVHLVSASISALKTRTTSESFETGDSSNDLKNAFAFTRRAKHISNLTFGEILHYLNSTMDIHFLVKTVMTSEHWSMFIYSTSSLMSAIDEVGRESLKRAASLTTVAARHTMLRYIHHFGENNNKGFLTKFGLAVFALQDWLDPLSGSTLDERSETLSFLFTTHVRPEDVVSKRSLWELGIIAAHSLSEPNPIDCAELLRILLTSARGRRALMNRKFTVATTGETYDPKQLLRSLKGTRWELTAWSSERVLVTASEVKLLAEELEQLAFGKTEVYVQSRHFKNTVSVAAARLDPANIGSKVASTVPRPESNFLLPPESLATFVLKPSTLAEEKRLESMLDSSSHSHKAGRKLPDQWLQSWPQNDASILEDRNQHRAPHSTLQQSHQWSNPQTMNNSGYWPPVNSPSPVTGGWNRFEGFQYQYYGQNDNQQRGNFNHSGRGFHHPRGGFNNLRGGTGWQSPHTGHFYQSNTPNNFYQQRPNYPYQPFPFYANAFQHGPNFNRPP